MTNLPLKLPAEYWQNFSVTKRDIEFLQNYLFETETPLTPPGLAAVLVEERIRLERETQAKEQKNSGEVYLPKESYKKGQRLIFPALGLKKGTVNSIRPGNNPEIGAFDVLEIALEDGVTRYFAASLVDHKLNLPPEEKADPESDPQTILAVYGEDLARKLDQALKSDESLVRIAEAWFPQALLVDINAGHLNLAEAVLEMNGGEPMPAAALMEQVDVPRDSNLMLTEFSMNYALQEDGRFDEVGPTGEVLWCLKRLEPDEVQNIPPALKYDPVDYKRELLNPQMLALEAQLDDELSETDHKPPKTGEVTITLTYPHWRAGTLPISSRVQAFFPTAIESPRIRFTLVDGKTGEKLPAWVVREYGYVFGLRKWYEKQKLIPGAYLVVRHGKTPGEVIVEAKTHRPNRDWVRTVLAGTDGGLVFAVLKQDIACEYNERMALVVPDVKTVDAAFLQVSKSRQSLERLTRDMLRELAKLTPQGHVHAEELYSAVNILRRVPPAPLFATLAASTDFVHVGDLHFRLAESILEEQ
jgi:hypothetical protein